tara:strand:- start:805 stop:1293 length:489 start_codon:yes stop_codon:yes gene_type:complete
MPYNQEQQRNLFSQDDPFETTEEAMRKMYRQEPYSVPITEGLSVTPLLSYDMIKESHGPTDIDINARSFGAGVNTPLGTFRGAKNLVNVDVDFPEGQEEFKGKGYSLGYSKFNEKGYGGEIDVGIQPMPEGIRTSWQIEAKAYWDSGELLGTILKTFKNLAD